MRFSLIIILSAFISQNSLAQNFFKQYGNSNDEVGNSVIEMQDSSFLVFGTSSSFIDGTSNFYLMNIDTLGNFKWSKTYGGSNIEQGYDICYKPNRNYLLSGYSNSFGDGYEVLAIEVDSVGNEIWSKTYGGSDWDFSYSNLSFPNGDVLITGNTYSFGNGDSDGFLLMINNVGDSLWWKNYGTSTENVLRKTILTTAGDLVSVGYTQTVNGDRDFYLVKCHITGDTIWTKSIGTPEDDEGFTISEDINGNYIVGGYSKGINMVDEESYYFTTDTSGTILWTQNIGGAGQDIFYDLIAKPNEYNFLVAGVTSYLGSGGKEARILNLTIFGGYYNNANNYGTINQEELHALILTSKNKIISVGKTNNPYLNEDVMVVYTDTLLPTQSTLVPYEDVTAISEYESESFLFYPNPTQNFIQLDNSSLFEKLEILDLDGRFVFEVNQPSEEIFFNLPNGIYFIRLASKNGNLSIQKLVVQD